MRFWSLILVAVAGLMGAAGVAAAAGAAHGAGGENLQNAANFLLFHASIVAALALGGRLPRPGFLAAATALAVGVPIFSGDLALQATKGAKLFNYAAPLGGTLMIAGWLMLTIAALIEMVRRAEPA
jgi:uncharacterized membrane protein YgdD (TMEM256/DUF423 family)